MKTSKAILVFAVLSARVILPNEYHSPPVFIGTVAGGVAPA